MGKEPSINYYEVLQVSPGADREMIERAFRLLAKRYHPDNKDTGDPSKFKFIVEAYQVLSDSEKRAAYDDGHNGTVNTQRDNILLNVPQSRNPDAEKRINQIILYIFYLARERDATKPGVTIIELEKLAGLTEKELDFHVWYLKEKGWIQRMETGEFSITASGVDEVLEKNIVLRKDRLLSYETSFDIGVTDLNGI